MEGIVEWKGMKEGKNKGVEGIKDRRKARGRNMLRNVQKKQKNHENLRISKNSLNR